MSYVIAAPEYVANAAMDLANIGSAISDANSAASGPVSSVLPAGADEVSAGIASLFDAHAQVYQALSAAAQAFHTQFVQLMSAGAEQYALTEAANATPLQTVQNMVTGNVPGQALSSAQPLASTAASAGSAAAGVPAAAAGVSGGAAPAAPAAPLATAVTPA
ncbi:PE family protein, partial [Mycobacterium sp. E796]|uniref:PE family protein n=1 Tax=Mycobacterium sp. E796 TaxID=1834151 RepID=UPI000A6791C3